MPARGGLIAEGVTRSGRAGAVSDNRDLGLMKSLLRHQLPEILESPVGDRGKSGGAVDADIMTERYPRAQDAPAAR
jgi:hypothetical protein